MSAADVTLHGLDWLRALLGFCVFLLPGLAAADRWLVGLPARFLWAPLFSFTLLALAAILLDFLVGLPVSSPVTFALSLFLAGMAGRRRLMELWRTPVTARVLMPRNWRKEVAGVALGVVAVSGFLFVAHSLPHLDGAGTASTQFPEGFAFRAWDLATGQDLPYPVHVDEHLHLAFMGALDRTGDIEGPHPYTGEPRDESFLTVNGLRSERGFHVAMVQLHQLTGASLMTVAHFVPALWGAYLGICVWLLLSPGSGALASAALTAVLPTTLRFLGVGFLVPIAFSLPWILAVLAVAHRVKGPRRLAALFLFVTGAFVMHIVAGTVALVAGVLVAVLGFGTPRERAGIVGALLLPLLWLLPSAWPDVQDAVTTRNGLPFQQGIFLSFGTPLLALAVLGTGWAWLRRDDLEVAPRVASVLSLGAIASMEWSIRVGHDNDATYGRLIPILALSLAILAGRGLGAIGWTFRHRLARVGLKRTGLSLALVAMTGLTVLAVAHPLEQHMAEPYYRVFDAQSWARVEAFAASDAGPADIVLAHPWQAPVLNALTGARPYTYLLPGSYPVNGTEYIDYRSSQWENPQWLKERGITYVVDEQRPAAPHVEIRAGVYKIL